MKRLLSIITIFLSLSVFANLPGVSITKVDVIQVDCEANFSFPGPNEDFSNYLSSTNIDTNGNGVVELRSLEGKNCSLIVYYFETRVSTDSQVGFYYDLPLTPTPPFLPNYGNIKITNQFNTISKTISSGAINYNQVTGDFTLASLYDGEELRGFFNSSLDEVGGGRVKTLADIDFNLTLKASVSNFFTGESSNTLVSTSSNGVLEIFEPALEFDGFYEVKNKTIDEEGVESLIVIDENQNEVFDIVNGNEIVIEGDMATNRDIVPLRAELIIGELIIATDEDLAVVGNDFEFLTTFNFETNVIENFNEGRENLVIRLHYEERGTPGTIDTSFEVDFVAKELEIDVALDVLNKEVINGSASYASIDRNENLIPDILAENDIRVDAQIRASDKILIRGCEMLSGTKVLYKDEESADSPSLESSFDKFLNFFSGEIPNFDTAGGELVFKLHYTYQGVDKTYETKILVDFIPDINFDYEIIGSNPKTFPIDVNFNFDRINTQLDVVSYQMIYPGAGLWLQSDGSLTRGYAVKDVQERKPDSFTYRFKGPGREGLGGVVRSIVKYREGGVIKERVFRRRILEFDNTNFLLDVKHVTQFNSKWADKAYGGWTTELAQQRFKEMEIERVRDNPPIPGLNVLTDYLPKSYERKNLKQKACAVSAVSSVFGYHALTNKVSVSNQLDVDVMNDGLLSGVGGESGYTEIENRHRVTFSDDFRTTKSTYFLGGAAIKWQSAANYFRSRFSNLAVDFKIVTSGDLRGILKENLRDGTPVIVKTNSRSSGGRGDHFVVAYGLNPAEDKILIKDPGSRFTGSLGDDPYEGRIKAIYLYQDKKDPAFMQINVTGADFLVTAPDGKRLGIDPASGEAINEMPFGSGYTSTYIPDLDRDESDEEIEMGAVKMFFAPIPVEGEYKIEIFNNEYSTGGTLNISTYDDNGYLNFIESKRIKIEKGVVLEETVVTSNEAAKGGTLSIEKVKYFRAKRKYRKRLRIRGSFDLGRLSNGVDLEKDNILVKFEGVDNFSKTFSLNRKKVIGDRYLFRDSLKKERVKLTLREDGRFDMFLSGKSFRDLPPFKDLDIELRIGDDLLSHKRKISEDFYEGKLEITKARFKHRSKRMGKVILKGKIKANEESDGLNPILERVSLEINGSVVIAPIDRKKTKIVFKRIDNGFVYKAEYGRRDYRIKIMDNGEFRVFAHIREPMSIIEGSSDTIVLKIGNDILKGEVDFKKGSRKK